jgi:multiple sugar transport system permease protein
LKGDWIIKFFLLIGLLVTSLFILLPVLHSIQLSFFKLESFISKPEWVGLKNYGETLKDPVFWRDLLHGCIYAGMSIFFQLLFGIAIALVLKQSFVGKQFVRGISLLPYLIPTAVVALTFLWMVNGTYGIINIGLAKIGIYDVRWLETPVTATVTCILVSVWLWTPFVTTCFLAGLQTVPMELYDAAKVDGLGPWRTFWQVTIPVLKPILTIIVLLRAIWMFNKFDIIWLLTKGGPVGATEHLPILAYQKAFSFFDVGGGAAVATISFLILSIVVFIYFRLFPLEEN